MKCRSCGTEIADKALICYRCGTPTTEAKYQPAEVRLRRRPAGLLWVVIVIVALALAAAYFLHLLG